MTTPQFHNFRIYDLAMFDDYKPGTPRYVALCLGPGCPWRSGPHQTRGGAASAARLHQLDAWAQEKL